MSDEYISPYNEDVRAGQCYFCPKRSNLESHHIVPQRMNGSDKAENLVIVCDRCHDKLEQLYDKRFFERLGLSDDSGDDRSHFACGIGDCRTAAVVKIQQNACSMWYCRDCAVDRIYRSIDRRHNSEVLEVDDGIIDTVGDVDTTTIVEEAVERHNDAVNTVLTRGDADAA